MEKFVTTIHAIELNDMERSTLKNACRIIYDLSFEVKNVKIGVGNAKNVKEVTNEKLTEVAELLDDLKNSYFIEEIADNWEEEGEVE